MKTSPIIIHIAEMLCRATPDQLDILHGTVCGLTGNECYLHRETTADFIADMLRGADDRILRAAYLVISEIVRR